MHKKDEKMGAKNTFLTDRIHKWPPGIPSAFLNLYFWLLSKIY
jgi:hypothetical protein